MNKKPTLIIGAQGVGKTHLMNALLKTQEYSTLFSYDAIADCVELENVSRITKAICTTNIPLDEVPKHILKKFKVIFIRDFD